MQITSYLSDIRTDESQDQQTSSAIENDDSIVYFAMDSLNHFCDIFEVSSIKKFWHDWFSS